MTQTPVRVPPHSDEAERAAVGAMLIEPDVVVPMALVKFRLRDEAFYDPRLRCLFRVVAELHGNRKPVNLISVCEVLRVRGMEEDAGGEGNVERCVDACPTAAHAEYFLDTIRQRWIQRELINRARELQQAAYEAESGEDLLAGVSQRFSGLVDQVVVEADNATLMDVSIGRWEDARAFREGDTSKAPAIGIKMPWSEVTEMMCGLEPGLTVLAGRPSAGKTTAEDMISVCAAEAGLGVCRGTLDTTHGQLLERTLCRLAGVSLPKLKFGFATHGQLAECRRAKEHIRRLPMFINENILTVEDFCSWVRMMKSRRDIKLATFDYVQLMTVRGGSQFMRDNDNARGEYISMMLKRLGNDLGIPVLALSQLNRNVEKDNRNPNMSDLRGSGGLEQAADKVVFLYADKDKRDEMDEKTLGATKTKRPVWWHTVKNKNGETGQIPLWLYAPYFRFEVAKTVNGVNFVDDALPGDHRETRVMHQSWPETEPQDEQGVSYEEPSVE